jgi:hypothetical protein
LQDPDQSTGEADLSSKRQAFTMLKHRCAALLIFTMPKHRWATLVTFFPMLKHHCSALFISSHFQKHSSPPFPHHFSLSKQLRPALVSPFSLLLLKHHHQQLFTFSFPLLKHRYQQPFIIFFPMLKHHCSTFFISSHSQNTSTPHFPTIFIAETTPSSTCFDVLLLLLKHHLSATLHFLTLHHRRNNSVQQLFRLFSLLKHSCQQPFFVLLCC